jgi:hypothetical protein
VLKNNSYPERQVPPLANALQHHHVMMHLLTQKGGLTAILGSCNHTKICLHRKLDAGIVFVHVHVLSLLVCNLYGITDSAASTFSLWDTMNTSAALTSCAIQTCSTDVQPHLFPAHCLYKSAADKDGKA